MTKKLFSRTSIFSLAIFSVFSLLVGSYFLLAGSGITANAASNETFNANDRVTVVNLGSSTLNVRVDSNCGKVFSSVKNGATGTVKSVGATDVTCNSFTGKFVRVAFDNGPDGFVANSYITKGSTPAPAPTNGRVKVNIYSGNLNVRSASCGTVLTTVVNGSQGTIQTDATNGTKGNCNGGTWTFIKVKFDNGVTGFVAQELLANI